MRFQLEAITVSRKTFSELNETIVAFSDKMGMVSLFQEMGFYGDFELLLNIIWGSVCGFFVNHFYIKNSLNKIKVIVENHSSPEEEAILVELRKKGGVNWFAPPIALTLIVAFLILFG